MRRTLILNAGYQAITAIGWQRAMCLKFRDRIEVVQDYEDWFVNSAAAQHAVPAVARIPSYTRPPSQYTKFSRENVYVRDMYTCQYCYQVKQPRSLTFDHVVPKSKGGKTSWTNIVTACRKCNHKKADKTLAEADMKLMFEPIPPNPLSIRRQLLTRGQQVPPEWEPFLQY